MGMFTQNVDSLEWGREAVEGPGFLGIIVMVVGWDIRKFEGFSIVIKRQTLIVLNRGIIKYIHVLENIIETV